MSITAGVLLMSGIVDTGSVAQVNVLTQHNEDARTGVNQHESILTPGNVSTARFGLLWKLPVDDQVYSQPLYLSNVSVHGGTHDLVFITTVNNSVYAFDANAPIDAKPLWHVNFGTPANLYDADFGCLDINGSMGIIGTPVLNVERGALYVVALTRSGGGFEQRLHALDVATGADLKNSPATITAPAFDPLMQNQRPALALANGNVYIGYASHCDKGPYHGFVFGYDANTLAQTAVLNTSPTGDGNSIWQSGQAPAVDSVGNLYVVTGNGDWDGVSNFSESFLKLDPHLKILDWFTPGNHEQLDKEDADLNSSGATLLPGTNRVIGGGKQGVLYSLDTSSLGHLGDEHALQHLQATGSHLHSLVFWHSERQGSLLYVWGQRDHARVYKVDAGGVIDPKPAMVRPEANEGHPGAMLSLSANGGRDGILWAAIHATGDSWHESRPGILHAYAADDIQHELWNSWQNRGRDDCDNYSKMAPPTIANGKVYLASFGTQNVGTGGLCIYGLLPGGPSPQTPAGLAATITAKKVTLTWQPVAGARTYTVSAAAQAAGPFHLISAGLTTPVLRDLPVQEHSEYFVVQSQNSNGHSEMSVAVSAVSAPSATERPM
jgi:hypothetical protein